MSIVKGGKIPRWQLPASAKCIFYDFFKLSNFNVLLMILHVILRSPFYYFCAELNTLENNYISMLFSVNNIAFRRYIAILGFMHIYREKLYVKLYQLYHTKNFQYVSKCNLSP